MNIKKAGLRWLGHSILLVVAAIVTGCASDAPLDPSRSSTVPVISGGPSDTGFAITAATNIALRQSEKLVELGGCDSLRVPEGQTLATQVFARGVQIYRWSGTAWVFVAPSANLYANREARGVIGTHYAGPTWETNSGSKVVGAVVKKCPATVTSIPWLLLRAVSVEGAGRLHDVTYIQRLNTVGGNAPAAAGTVIGEEVSIPYTADYLFYREK